MPELSFPQFAQIAYAARDAHPGESTVEALRAEEVNQMVGALDGVTPAIQLFPLVRSAREMAEEMSELKRRGSQKPVTQWFARREAKIRSLTDVINRRGDIDPTVARKVAKEAARICYVCGEDLSDAPAYENGAGHYCTRHTDAEAGEAFRRSQ